MNVQYFQRVQYIDVRLYRVGSALNLSKDMTGGEGATIRLRVKHGLCVRDKQYIRYSYSPPPPSEPDGCAK